MSASREKKQRQNAGPDQKSVKVQQAQAAQKRQTIIYIVVGVVIAALVAALLVWRSGFFQARFPAATVGDETLTAAELSYYYYNSQARQQAVAYASYGMGTFDASKADDQQFFNQSENKTYRDYFMEEALKDAQQHKALAEEAVRQGHTEAEIQESLEEQIHHVKSDAAASGTTYGAYLKNALGPYMTPAIYEKYTARYLMANLLVNEKYSNLYDGYGESDLEAHYKDNTDGLDTIEYSYLTFTVPTVNTKDEQGNDIPEDELQKLKDEAEADTEKNAQEALQAIKDGETFQSQGEKYSLGASNYRDHAKVVGTSGINFNFSQQLLELEKDEPRLLNTANGIFVIALHDRFRDEEPTHDVRHIAVLAETGTDESGNPVAPTDEAWAEAEKKAQAILDEYNAGGRTEDDFIALVRKYAAENNGGEDGLYTRIASSNTTLVPEFVEWAFKDHQPGDAELVRHSAADSDSNKYWGYHVMYYVKENEPVWKGTSRRTMATEGSQSWIEELGAANAAALLGGADQLGR